MPEKTQWDFIREAFWSSVGSFPSLQGQDKERGYVGSNVPWAEAEVPRTEMFLKLVSGGTRLSGLVEFPSSYFNSAVKRSSKEFTPSHC